MLRPPCSVATPAVPHGFRTMRNVSAEEVAGPTGRFVIRTEVRGLDGSKGLIGFGVPRLWALIAGRRGWVITVRRSTEDPFGEPLVESVATNRDTLRSELERVRVAVRSGRLG